MTDTNNVIVGVESPTITPPLNEIKPLWDSIFSYFYE